MASLLRRMAAEFIGTIWLVFAGCGSAVIAAAFPEGGIGLLGVALAFGLSVLTMAYSIGHISGCHLNPAVTLGLWAGKRFAAADIVPYIAAQLGGGLLAALALYAIATGRPEFDIATSGLAQNGYGAASPGGYSLGAVLVTEALLTAFFLIVVLGSTDARAPLGFAPLSIGLALTLIHLISIPISNTSVNPARSTGPALVVGGLALQQLWLFWLAPAVGGIIGGISYRLMFPAEERGPRVSGEKRARPPVTPE